MAQPPPPDISSLKKLQAEVNAAFDKVYATAEKDGATAGREHAQAMGLLAATFQKTSSTLQDPVTKILGATLQPLLVSAIRIAVDLNIPTIVASKPSITLSELAKQTQADADIIKRIMRFATTEGYFAEAGPSEWRATPLTHVLANPVLGSWVIAHSNKRIQIAGEVPQWLAKHKYHNSWTSSENPAVNILGTEFWAWVGQNAYETEHFDRAMSIQDNFPPSMFPHYPYEGCDSNDQVLLVDVGGGAGQAISSIKPQVPPNSGRFVVQDLEKSISALTPAQTADFEPMIHDFFTSQPVQDAKYYFLRRVFHDWHDEPSLEILKALKPAMKKGYSKLLIQDTVLPDQGAEYLDAGLDLLMLSLANGMERTESEWKILLEKAGFRIIKIWLAEVGRLGIIESEVV